MQGWFDKVEILLLFAKIITKTLSWSVAPSYDELIIRHTRIFEKMRGEVHVLQRGSTVQ